MTFRIKQCLADVALTGLILAASVVFSVVAVAARVYQRMDERRYRRGW